MSLNGNTLFITGASRGMGLAIALKWARDGANIAIATRFNIRTRLRNFRPSIKIPLPTRQVRQINNPSKDLGHSRPSAPLALRCLAQFCTV